MVGAGGPAAGARPCAHASGGIQIAGKEEKVEMEGEVVEAFRSGMYKILLDNGFETLGYTAGRMRRHRIRIAPGDRITIELSPYDLSRGRIVYRIR
jgi:translation initiation factor IF-1